MENFAGKWSSDVYITGVDTKGDVVALCNKIARNVGFEHLEFKAQNVESFTSEKVDMLVALHACDTATDEATSDLRASGWNYCLSKTKI